MSLRELDRKPNHEIELKFLLRTLPETLADIPQSEIEQGYHAVAPGKCACASKMTRYDIPFRDRLVEIDIYDGRHEGLAVAEVEFPDEQSRVAFARPDWFGDDVTGNSRYSNQLLASQGEFIPARSADHGRI